MITSPTPTQPNQQPPEKPAMEEKRVKSTPRRRPGQSPVALFFKAILRPIFKGLYYVLTFVRNHKLVSIIALLLIIGSSVAVSYYETGQWPFGIGNDPFNFHVHGSNGGGDQVRNWLYALRDGDVVTLSVIDRFMSNPPDAQQLVNELSEGKSHLTWKSITVVGVQQESDTTVDSLVEVDLSASGPQGNTSAYAIFHFVSADSQSGGSLLLVANLDQIRGSQLP